MRLSLFFAGLLHLSYIIQNAIIWASPPVPPLNSSSPAGLTIHAAVDSALKRNSALYSDSLEISRTLSALLQARLAENPEFSIEAEDIGLANSSFERGTRFTWEVEQSFQPAARMAGVQVAKAGVHVAEIRFQTQKADLIAVVKSSFFDCLASQHLLSLSDTLLGVARKAHEISVLQARAGKTPISDTLITYAEYSLALMRRERERLKLANVYRGLSSLWGGAAEPFVCVGTELDSVIAVPDSGFFLAQIDTTPLIGIHDALVSASKAELGYEKAYRIPLVKAGAGMERVVGTSKLAPKVSLSFSIPILDWNQGAIRAAKYVKLKAEMVRQNAITQLRKDLINTWQTASGLYKEMTLLKTAVLPQYRMSFEASLLSYKSGKSDVQILISAQKAFFEFSREYLETALEYRKTIVELERISGAALLK